MVLFQREKRKKSFCQNEEAVYIIAWQDLKFDLFLEIGAVKILKIKILKLFEEGIHFQFHASSPITSHGTTITFSGFEGI